MSKKNNSRANDLIKVKTRFPVRVTLIAGLGSVQLDSQLDSTLSNLANVYRYYRFTNLKVTLSNPPISEVHIAQFTSGVGETAPVSTSNLSNYGGEHLGMTFIGQTTPSTFVVPRTALAGAHMWYMTDHILTNIEESVVGFIYVGSNDNTSTTGVFLMLEIEAEYSALYDAAQLASNFSKKESLCSPCCTTCGCTETKSQCEKKCSCKAGECSSKGGA